MTDVYLERGTKKVFACAYDWPGWARSGKTDEDALEALAAYAPRYRRAVGRRFTGSADLSVVETVQGSASTDFGVPGIVTDRDREPVSRTEAARLARLVVACWDYLDAAVAVAPASLRKGPRGGGRDRDPMYAHVLDAEDAYGRKLGIGGGGARPDILAALRAAAPPEEKRWPVPYAARRIAWHALDHAWEMEDRTD